MMEYDLVFEGGGAKGAVYVGAIRALEGRGHKVRRVIGTSAGSIVAALVAAGYSAQECLAALQNKLPDGRAVFASFMDTPNIDADDDLSASMRGWLITELDNPAIPNSIEPFVDRIMDNLLGKELVRHLLSLLLWGGWYSGKAFREWMTERLDQDGRGLGNSTLREFHAKTGSDLSMAATDITGHEMLVLNHRTAPDCPTVWAVRMSMGCPFAWPEVVWKAEWGTYRGRDITGHKVVDGGLLSNFPIDLFVSQDANIDEMMGECSATENVIGLLIDENIQVPGVEGPLKHRDSGPGLVERLDLLQETVWRLRGMTDTVLSGHDRTVLDAYEFMVCRLPAKDIGTMDFDMSEERMNLLVSAGEAAMNAHLDERSG